MSARGDGRPEVSVVIGARDAEARIDATLDSVLAQRSVGLECLVVDDGSRDATAARVARRARHDPRLRLLRQAAAGLTRALMHGCAEARGALVARIDAGDRMLPGRLRRQAGLLREARDVVMVATRVRLCGPRGEPLEAAPPAAGGGLIDLGAELRSCDARGLTRIPHISVCFRRGAYRAAGGYRPAFRLAQDVDLWPRLAEHGRVLLLEEALTEVRVELDGLSPRHHRTQLALRELAARAARVRRSGGDESALLATAERLSRRALGSDAGSGAAAYFVGACLARRGALDAAEDYFRIALDREPLSLRARLASARLRVRRLAARAGGVQ